MYKIILFLSIVILGCKKENSKSPNSYAPILEKVVFLEKERANNLPNPPCDDYNICDDYGALENYFLSKNQKTDHIREQNEWTSNIISQYQVFNDTVSIRDFGQVLPCRSIEIENGPEFMDNHFCNIYFSELLIDNDRDVVFILVWNHLVDQSTLYSFDLRDKSFETFDKNMISIY